MVKKFKTPLKIVCFVWVFACCFSGGKARAENPYRPLSASLWIGCYTPRDSTFRKIYSDDAQAAGYLEFSKIWTDRIETVLGLGGLHFTGKTLNNDGTVNIDKTRLTLAAGYIQLSYLLRFHKEQRLVPYLGSGLDAWGYREKTEKDTVRGCKYGYHFQAGIRFLLDWLEPKAAAGLFRDHGIENTYLVIEARYSQIDNFGKSRLDLSGPIYKIGLLVEF